MLLVKPLLEEKHSYSSPKSKPDLIENIKKELSGKFISTDEFYITSATSLFFSDSGSSGHNSLKGKITTNNGKVVIDLIVKPVPRIYVEVFAPILFGLVYLFYLVLFSAALKPAPLLYSAVLIVIIPLLVLFLGQASKNRLRKRCVDTLKLQGISASRS